MSCVKPKSITAFVAVRTVHKKGELDLTPSFCCCDPTQSWDWDSYYAQRGVGTTGAFNGKHMPKFPERNVGGWSMYDHGVNNAMGTKSCTVWYSQPHIKTALLFQIGTKYLVLRCVY